MISSLLYLLLVNLGLSLPTTRHGLVHVPLYQKAVNATDFLHVVEPSAYSDVVDEVLWNVLYAYIAQFEIGNPPQSVSALLDTGSADLWLPGSQNRKWVAAFGKVEEDVRALNQVFDPQKSTTYKLLDKGGFLIHYLKGFAKGDWGEDDVRFGDNMLVKSQRFGFDPDTSAYGVLGVGKRSLESAGKLGRYDNLPLSLKKAGHISQAAYSIYLGNQKPRSNGSILFGGVDKSKYRGQLYAVPNADERYLSAEFQVINTRFVGFLDTGATMSHFAESLIAQMVEEHDWDLTFHKGAYYAEAMPTGRDLKLSFSGAVIHIPLQSLLVRQGGRWKLGITPHTRDFAVIGQTILRSAYIVYHLEADVLAIAQSNPEPGEPDTVPITDATIPGAIPAPEWLPR